MEALDFLKKHGGLLATHPWESLAIAVISSGIGLGAADWYYKGQIDGMKERIDGLMETLQTREFPKPVIQTVTVPVADQSQKELISNLQGELKEATQIIDDLAHRCGAGTPVGSAHPSTLATPAQTATSVNQSGGVAQGQGGTIGTVNQNALPARSAFAAPLGQFYTEGYLVLQKASVLGLTDPQLSELGNQFDGWRQKVINWMNANMCPDAAAYFLKMHRSSLNYSGVPQNQNRLLDSLSWSLDNLSDIKRNDAWDCK